MPRTYKNPQFQHLYNTMLILAADKTSELYLPDGTPHRGAGHRCAFWDGVKGGRSAHAIPGTMSMVCHSAGVDWAKARK
jgi:hypothetical protein